MKQLSFFRLLVDQQLFETLLHEASLYFDETGDPCVLPLKALACAHLGDRGAAMDTYDHAYERIGALDPDARVDLAGVDCVLMRIEAAVGLLEPVVEQMPDHVLATARLAWCRMHQNRLEEARQLYCHATMLDRRRLPVWMALVRLYLEADNPLDAQETLHQALACFEQRQPELPMAVINIITAQLRGLQLEVWVAAQQFALAEQWLEQRRDSIEEDHWADLVVGYTALLAGKDRHAQAEEVLRRCLEHYPTNNGLIMQLVELAQLQGHFLQAVRLLQRAVRIDPENPALWSKLAHACLHRFDRQARSAAEKAVLLADNLLEGATWSPDQIKILRINAGTALAQVESQEQNYEIAEGLFQQVLNQDPYFVPALQGYGHQQMLLGRIDEAAALFERIKSVDPVKGYTALINARRFPEDEKILEKIHRAAHVPSLAGPVKAGILFQLASAWQKRRNYEKAFAYAKKANELSKRFLKYDAESHRNRCARIRHSFCKELYRHRPACGVDSSLPVYVLGMPRSGTTLVEQIISGHSKIFGAGELGVIPRRIAGLNRWERHVGSGRFYPDCIDDLTPYVTAGIANGIIDELKALAEGQEKEVRHVVDKLPHNFENIGLIKFLFPNARIISVRRDPREIAISNYFTDYQAKHGAMGFAYDLTWIGRQLADHNLLMHHWHQVFPGEILEIQYEELIDDPETCARKMLAYIGVDWEPRVLDFNKLDRPVKTASVWQVRQPIYKTAKGKWERYKDHLAPLTRGTNARIIWDPIVDMITMPDPGLLQRGTELFQEGDLDGAELSFKKMLHHNPAHAAANFMVGQVYCRKGHVADAVALFEKALEKCPWQKQWRTALATAYRETGHEDESARVPAQNDPISGQGPPNPFDDLFIADRPD